MGFDITIDKNNKIVVTGSSYNGLNGDMVILRYNQDGSLDTTLRNSGIVVYNNAAGGNGLDIGYAIKIDKSNNIIVAGSSFNGNNKDFAIWHFKDNGLIDNSFGNSGIVILDHLASTSSDDIAYDLVLDKNENIFVVGSSKKLNSNIEIAIVKLKKDGTLDSTFGNNGKVILGNINSEDKVYSITLDKNDKILIVGDPNINCTKDMAVVRLNPDGSLDNSFANNGYLIHNSAAGGNSTDIGYDIIVDNNNKILITGTSSDSHHFNMVIWKLNPDGSFDSSFGNNGIKVYFNIAGKEGDVGKALAIDNNNRVYVTGFRIDNLNDMVVWRINNSDGSIDKSFGENGVVVHHNTAGGRKEDIATSITINSDNKAVVTGFSNNGVDKDLVVWKLKD